MLPFTTQDESVEKSMPFTLKTMNGILYVILEMDKQEMGNFHAAGKNMDNRIYCNEL